MKSAPVVGAIAFLLGVTLSSFVSIGWIGIAALGALALAVGVLYALRRQTIVAIACVVFIAIALGAARTELAPKTLPNTFVPLLDTTASLDGVVATDPDVRETSTRIIVAVENEGVTTRILAVVPSYPVVRYGEHVRIAGTLERPEPFDTDGGRTFAYDKFLAKDGVFAMMGRAIVEVTGPREGIVTNAMGSLYDAKNAFVAALQAAFPEPESALAQGILVGGKQGLGKDLQDDFATTGLLQLVVLSGYNVAIVADAVQKLLMLVVSKAWALGGGALAIALFVLAAGSGSSAVRAGIMAAIALYARATGRTYNALRGLFAALIVMALINPLSIAFDPGLQLSALATLGLILGTPLVTPKLSWIKNDFLIEIVATTIAAQIAVLPFLLWQTGNLSLISFVANVLAMPVIPAAMLLSFIAGAVALVVPAIGPVLGFPAYILLSYVIGIAQVGAALPFAHVILPAFPFWLVVLAYGVLGWVVCRVSRPQIS